MSKAVSKAEEQRGARFNERVLSNVLALGGVAVADAWRPSADITTPCGLLRVTPIDTWVACRFEDAKWAKAQLPHDPLLSTSGKWNFDAGGRDNTLDLFKVELVRLLAMPTAERPIPRSQLPKPPPGHVRVRLVSGTLVVKTLRTFGKVWAMHYGVRTDENGATAATRGRGRSITHVPTGILVRHLTPVRDAVALGIKLGETFPDMGADLKLGSALTHEDLVQLLVACTEVAQPQDPGTSDVVHRSP